MSDRNARGLTLPAFALVVLFGGTNFVAGRFTLRELPPFWAATIRLAAASALLFALVWLQRLPLPRGRALMGTLVYGLLGFGAGYAFAYWGFQRVPAGLGAVVLAVTPVFTFGLALAHGQEAFRWRPLFGGGLALVGIGVMFSRATTTAVPALSLLAIVAMAICNAEASVVAKQFPKSHPVTTNAIAMLTGAVILGVLSIAFHEPHAYMFVLFPLVAVAMSTWLEHAPISTSLAAGGIVVLLGVFVGTVTRVPFVTTPHRVGAEPCLTCAE